MKKWMALLLALVLAMGTTSAMALDYSKGVQADVTVQLNKDALNNLLTMTGAYNDSSAPTPELINAVADLVGLVGLTAKTDNNNLLFDVKLNEKSIVSAQMDTAADGGLALTTNLLPSYAFVLDGQTMNMIKTQLNGAFTMDPAQMQKAADDLLIGLEKALEEELGAMKTTVISSGNASYTYKGVTFNYAEVKSVEPADAVEAVRRVMIRLFDLLDVYYKQLGMSMNELTVGLQQARQELENTDVYSNDYGNMTIKLTEYKVKENDGFSDDKVYLAIEAKNENQMIYATLAALDNNADITALIGSGSYSNPLALLMEANSGAPGAMLMDMSFEQGDVPEDVKVSMTMKSNGMSMKVVCNCEPDNMGGMIAKYYLYLLNDTNPLMAITYAIKPMTETLPAADLTGRQQMNIMELASGNGMDYELQQALTTELQNSATSLLINVITAAPEQVQTLMNEVTNMMNNQQNDYDDYDYDDYDYDYDY